MTNLIKAQIVFTTFVAAYCMGTAGFMFYCQELELGSINMFTAMINLMILHRMYFYWNKEDE